MTRSRTPHLDRYVAKTARRISAGKAPEDLTSAERRALLRRRVKIRRGRGEPQPDRHRLEGLHHHTCITPTCKKRYPCRNVCDPIDEGLKNSICDDCLVGAQCAVS